MPGVRDRNLRSGDLHEELGLVLLRTVGLVAPVPRPEDVGVDAFVTLVRPEGSRRLLPDLSFLVQLKAASVGVIDFEGPEELAWLRNLEIPLFVGRVHLAEARIELFPTHHLQQILLEQAHESIHLHLGSTDGWPQSLTKRRIDLGAPALAWSMAEVTDPAFLEHAHKVLRSHIDVLRRNCHLRDIQYRQSVHWEAGKPAQVNGMSIQTHGRADFERLLAEMASHVRRLIGEVGRFRWYADIDAVVGLIEMMRRSNVDPDPDDSGRRITAWMIQGPEASHDEVIHVRHRLAGGGAVLDLSHLWNLTESSLALIPFEVEQLGLAGTPTTDSFLHHLLRLTKLTRLDLAGTQVTDAGVVQLAALLHLRWLGVARTGVSDGAIDRLKASAPALEIIR